MTSLNDLDAELDAHIVGDLHYSDEAEPVTLATIDQADRALRRVRRVDQDMERIETLAKARIDQIEAWKNDRCSVLEGERAWWLRSLEGWTRAHHQETGTKTVKLPSGTVALRKAQAKVERVTDPADDTPDEWVRVKRDWDRQAIRKVAVPGPETDVDAPDGYVAHVAVLPTGEALDGVVLLVPIEDRFDCKPGADDE